MAAMDVAIEIGTSFTSIYLSGSGIVLREPSVVAFVGSGENRKILAVGDEAIKMQGRAPDKTTVVCPVADGYVTDADACKKMLTEFVKKILPTYIFFPKIRAILAVPTGLTVGERKVYEDIVRDSGVAEITMVDNVICTAIGCDLPVSSAAGGLIANVGGGVTEIAIVSLCGTVSGCSVNVGGNMMDKALVDYISGKYGLKIGLATARRIKEEAGSLYPNDISSLTVRGSRTSTGSPASLDVYASDVYEALYPYYSRIADAVVSVVNHCPPELASGIHGMGLFVAGGAARMPGIERVFAEVMGDVPINIAPDPEYTAIIGAGRLIGNREMLEQINAQQ